MVALTVPRFLELKFILGTVPVPWDVPGWGEISSDGFFLTFLTFTFHFTIILALPVIIIYLIAVQLALDTLVLV